MYRVILNEPTGELYRQSKPLSLIEARKLAATLAKAMRPGFTLMIEALD